MAQQETIDQTRASLERIQRFDPDSIGRKTDLGLLDFSEAIPSAQRIVETFGRINPSTLSIFSEGWLNHIRNHSDSAFNLLSRCLAFDPSNSGNAAEERRSLIQEMKASSDAYSDALAQQISLSVVSSMDPTETQRELRAALQRFEDDRAAALDQIEALNSQINEILGRVRDAAAEQGVAREASHFKGLADEHDNAANRWRGYSVNAGIGLLLFASFSSFSYRIPWLAPLNTIEAAQLITSKLVILGILSYGVVVCVRNFLSHKHNSVVNRHRQNALLTYTSFVDAAPSGASRDIVLTHAASSVFAPQETGYIRNEDPPSAKSIMEILTKSPLTEKGSS